MKRFIKDMNKYRRYLFYSIKAGLKSEVATSHLSWMWWVLDPLFFMLIYTFISVIVFRSTEPYFPVYVFIGLTVWNFFSKTLSGSVKLVKSRKTVLTRVYLPKWILTLERMGNLLFKMSISWILVLIMMFIWQVPFSLQLFNMIPIMIVLLTVTFGLSSILLHFGVFMDDLKNIIDIFLRLLFYLSGVFYNIYKRVPDPFNKIILRSNPAAFLMEQARKVIISQECPDYFWMGIWFGIGLAFAFIGVFTIYRYENSYAKVI